MQEHKYLENFINYYKNQWQKYFKNGMLDYSQISKSQRNNSYIENYNRRIKLKLSNFLYGKNKCKISWPLFLYFITHEEDEIKKENFNIDNSIEIKVEIVNQKDILKEETVKEKKAEQLPSLKEDEELPSINNFINEINVHRNWLKFREFSCRHDSFFLLYTFVIYNKLKIDIKDPIITNYNKITQELLQLDLENLNNGIWDILENNKTIILDLTKYGYKQYFTVMPHIQNFSHNKYFCIEYKVWTNIFLM